MRQKSRNPVNADGGGAPLPPTIGPIFGPVRLVGHSWRPERPESMVTGIWGPVSGSLETPGLKFGAGAPEIAGVHNRIGSNLSHPPSAIGFDLSRQHGLTIDTLARTLVANPTRPRS